MTADGWAALSGNVLSFGLAIASCTTAGVWHDYAHAAYLMAFAVWVRRPT
jgi:hypothetical protein